MISVFCWIGGGVSFALVLFFLVNFILFLCGRKNLFFQQRTYSVEIRQRKGYVVLLSGLTKSEAQKRIEKISVSNDCRIVPED